MPVELRHADSTTSRRPSVTGVVGRRHLPSRGLPAVNNASPAPLKRCRVDTPSRCPAQLRHDDDVTDDEDEWNKENKRPCCSCRHAVAVERRRRHDNHVDCDVIANDSSRCADGRQQSPDNHFYHTLEPTAHWCSDVVDPVYSHIYETIPCDDVSLEPSAKQRQLNRLSPVSQGTATAQRRHHSSAKKRVTFNVSIYCAFTDIFQ